MPLFSKAEVPCVIRDVSLACIHALGITEPKLRMDSDITLFNGDELAL